jgi:hypothetical protein
MSMAHAERANDLGIALAAPSRAAGADLAKSRPSAAVFRKLTRIFSA